MKKCEWKDDTRDQLIKRIKDTVSYLGCGVRHEKDIIIDILTCDKPEKPIIKKSGCTWAIEFKDIDYLVLNPKWLIAEWDMKQNFNMKKFLEEIERGVWIKPISEIEITDEIAKLRPMVIIGNSFSFLSILAMVKEDRVINIEKGIAYTNDMQLCRLANVSDLEDS